MYLFANSPTVDTLACKPTSPQSVAASCSACERPTLFARAHSTSTSNRLTVRCSDFTLKCIGGFVVYLNMIERDNYHSVTDEVKRTKWWQPLIRLAWAGQVQVTCMCSCNNYVYPLTTRDLCGIVIDRLHSGPQPTNQEAYIGPYISIHINGIEFWAITEFARKLWGVQTYKLRVIFLAFRWRHHVHSTVARRFCKFGKMGGNLWKWNILDTN